MKVVHVVRQSSAKLIYPRHQGLEMVSVLNAGICNLALCYSYFMPEKNPPYQKLIKAIQKLGVHDHLCLLYENTQEQFAAIVPFMRVGLERGEKCVYIADDNTTANVLKAMAQGGIETEAAIKSGSLVVLTKREAYLRQGYFDPDWMISFLKEATCAARAEGFTALRVTGEMTWVLGDPGSGRLIEYETKLNYFLPENDALAMCQYNMRRFSPELILDVIRTHPLVIYRGRVCRNFYYIPPDEFMLPNQQYLEVDRTLYNIIERERIEELRTQTEEDLQRAIMDLKEIERIGKIGSWEWNLKTDMVTWSDGTYRIFRRDPTMPPSNFTEHLKLYTPESRERLKKAVEQAIKTGMCYELELELARPDDSTRWVIARGEASRNSKGSITGLFGTVIDITESKIIIEELYNTAPCAYHSLDSDGRFVRINDTELKWLGYKREEVIGKMKFSDVITPESVTTFLKNFPFFLKMGYIGHLEFEFIRKDGTTFPGLLSSMAVKDRDGNYIMSNSVVYDMTERKKSEDELKKLNKELSEAHAKVKVLGELVPVCASCKRIRNDKGFWESVEKYIHEHSGAEFTHSLCPDCFKKLYPEFQDGRKKTG